MKATQIGLVAAATVALSGCGGLNSVLADRVETVEMYHVFDVKTGATPDRVIRAAADGIARNTNSVMQNRPLRMKSEGLPATPGRFEIVDVASKLGGGMGSLMEVAAATSGSITPRMAKCDGAVWTAKAFRDIPGARGLTLYNCLYQYKDGYQLDMYAVYSKREGLGNIGGAIASSLVGTPEQWVNKTIVDTMRSIESGAPAKIAHVEGQPEIGELPWTDALER